MEQIKEANELQRDVERLEDELDRVIEINKKLYQENCQVDSLWYQLNRASNEVMRDAWHWKWVIVLIGIEMWRLHLDAQHWIDIRSLLEGIASDLRYLLDAVDPHGMRG